MKPFASAADQNKTDILPALLPRLRDQHSLLEIGSGTGQHAVYFASSLPWLTWQCSDLPENLSGITSWINESGLSNLPDPIGLDVAQPDWPQISVDAVYSCNTTHIMHWSEVQSMFSGITRVLASGGLALLYGPFNRAGQYTSESNAQFDRMLRRSDPDSGLRDINELSALATTVGMTLQEEITMPCNNHLLVFQKAN